MTMTGMNVIVNVIIIMKIIEIVIAAADAKITAFYFIKNRVPHFLLFKVWNDIICIHNNFI